MKVRRLFSLVVVLVVLMLMGTMALAQDTPTPAATPATLPVTGGSPVPWALVALAVGGLLLVGGMSLALARRS